MISILLILWMLAWGRVFIFPILLLVVGVVSVASLSDSHRISSGCHLKSIRYHFVFSVLTFPPVALATPEKY